MDELSILKDFISAPGPAGEEYRIRNAVIKYIDKIGCIHRTDARGNLLIAPPGVKEFPKKAGIIVTAHLDEIAMIVERIESDGALKVAPLGGLFPWKCGECPVTIMAAKGDLKGILGFGSIHTNSPESPIVRAREHAISWELARVFTGKSYAKLVSGGVRPGTRVVLGEERRTLTEFGEYIAAPFLDDRADIAAMILALLELSEMEENAWVSETKTLPILFAATAAEEVGGHGALSLFRSMNPEIAIALEIGPRVPESYLYMNGTPSVWTNDGYSAMQARDIDLVADAATEAGIDIQWQALSRGGSDASCAASHGLVDRPFTLAFAAENSHGYEITHKHSIRNLSKLLVALLRKLKQVD